MMIAHILLINDQNREQKVENVTYEQGRPVFELFLQPFVEDLVEEEQNLAVQKNTIYFLVRYGRLIAARGHFKRPQKVGHERLYLRHVLALFFDQLEHNTVAFS